MTPGPPAVLLAGGLARRMGGGDKCLAVLSGRPLLAHVIERIRPQASGLLLNANGDPARFATFGLPVQGDPIAGNPGPLVGILAGMRWAEGSGASHVVSLPTDTPFFPTDLVRRLIAGRTPGRPIVTAASGGTVHPVFALWPTELAQHLEEALTAGQHGVDRFARTVGRTTIDWPTGSLDPFFNINTRDDLASAERALT